MNDEQKTLVAETAAAVVRNALRVDVSTSDEEVKRQALAAVDALMAAFAKINAAD